jgi:hypothetical protein
LAVCFLFLILRCSFPPPRRGWTALCFFETLQQQQQGCLGERECYYKNRRPLEAAKLLVHVLAFCRPLLMTFSQYPVVANNSSTTLRKWSQSMWKFLTTTRALHKTMATTIEALYVHFEFWQHTIGIVIMMTPSCAPFQSVLGP